MMPLPNHFMPLKAHSGTRNLLLREMIWRHLDLMISSCACYADTENPQLTGKRVPAALVHCDGPQKVSIPR
jgi:hypothetical protein